MNGRRMAGFLAGLGMAALILDGKTALAGAADGMNLCVRSIVPSLFPFFFLTGMLTASLLGQELKLLRPLGRLLGFPQGTESILICAFLGGYPSGAQAVAAAWEKGHLTTGKATALLSFCNNAGPSFLFGMLRGVFPNSSTLWLLWGIQIAAALMVAGLQPGTRDVAVTMQPPSFRLSLVIQGAIRSMAIVCGWVLLFRIVIAFLDRWLLWLCPQGLRVMLLGLLELTNGCLQLPAVQDEGLRFLLCSAMLSLGGLCITMQTASVAGPLPLGSYYRGKLLHCSLCLLLSWGILCRFWWLLAALGAGYALILKKRQKYYSISPPCPV